MYSTFILVSRAGHLALLGIYDFFLPISISCFLIPVPQLVRFLYLGRDKTLVPEGSVPLVVLPALGYWSVSLTFTHWAFTSWILYILPPLILLKQYNFP